jgi:exo-1,4-beta-D-glucosaminidase
MGKKIIAGLYIAFLIVGSSCSSPTGEANKLILNENWSIQSSTELTVGGQVISTSEYKVEDWYPVSVPSTVLAGLVENGVYPDPYYGTNIEDIPGYTTQRRGEMPEDSPFNVSWWYRTEIKIPSGFNNKNIWINFQSINYQANIWLNGKLVADTAVVEGAYRIFEFDISEFALPGQVNYLALEIFPPKSTDLSITWVDWNPTPPDRGIGIWYDVSLYATGQGAIKNPHVVTDLDLPSLDQASLTVSAELLNAGDEDIEGVLKGVIEDIEFSRKVLLKAGESKQLSFTPDEYPQLRVQNPRLWWPNNVGPQNLYDLKLTLEVDGKISDVATERFGIREITSWMNTFDDKRTTIFQVNGKNIVIRGGGYVEDMMLRPDKKRTEADVLYAKHMNLNALRMEAPRGPDYIYDLCDENGIMLIVGWCCCSQWERWQNWTPHIADIAEESWKDQVIRLRNHPSVFNWLLGSDNPPPGPIEQRYIDVLNTYDGTRPFQSSATQDSSDVLGYTGLWMGPFPKVYAYNTPNYWYSKLEFNTEAGPNGEQIPPVESLRKMMPEEDLWPISESWNIRLHTRFYLDAREALFSRYGEPSDVEEYSMKSQLLQKEAVRAMYEAFARNKYRSSGIIFWMYNSAWPSLYWQLYDYFLTPNGAFYGAKIANEPLHIQYSYDDSTIYVINSMYQDVSNLQASAAIYNLDMEEKYTAKTSLDIAADESKKVMDIDWPEDLSETYFLKLSLTDGFGVLVSSNLYWLSSIGDEQADFTALEDLPESHIEISDVVMVQESGKYNITFAMENTSGILAFDINPKIKGDRSKELVLPVFWDDNYFSLLPGEKRDVSVSFDKEDLAGERPILHVDGWNLTSLELAL